MESSILSEVDNTSDSQDGLSTRLLLSSQLATNLSALAPAKRAGAQRLCALALPCRARPSPCMAVNRATADLNSCSPPTKWSSSDASHCEAAYLTRFHPTSPVPPIDAGSVHLISSPVNETIVRFCSVPAQAGQVLPSTLSVMTLSATV